MTRGTTPISTRADRSSAAVHERVTLDVDLSATYDNPFDADEVSVEAEVDSPGKGAWHVPGFFYQAFERRLEGEKEMLAPVGAARWQLRLSFASPGLYRVRVRVADQSGVAHSEPVAVEVVAADASGMIRRHEADRRYFVTDCGDTFFPVGANVCWAGSRGTFDYDEWLPRYAQSGCNLVRVWLAPYWATCAMHTQASGFNRIDLANAWRLDRVMEAAEKCGIRVILCIDSFNTLRSVERLYGRFEESPFAAGNGGPLTTPAAYFTDEQCRQAYRNRLRYLVARYGCSTSVFAWELWNEVDLVDGYDARAVTSWHATAARTLQALDPWRHLLTTSASQTPGLPELDAVPGLDFLQTHHYGTTDAAAAVAANCRARRARTQRPHFHGEFGISHSGEETARLDPAGIHLHNALYASVGQAEAGAPLSWWWDSYIHALDLYPVFSAFSKWIEGFDFAAQHVQPIQARVVYEERAETDSGRTQGGVERSAKRVPPALRVSGVQGDSEALVWVQNAAYVWPALGTPGSAPAPVRNATVELNAFRAGPWQLDIWDTRRGQVMARKRLNVSANGLGLVHFAEVEWDVALRLRRF